MNAPSPRIFQFVGGDLCLDFCNTVGGKRGGTTREYLNSYSDLLNWAEQAKLLHPADVQALTAEAGRHPNRAVAVVNEAVILREAIYRIMAAAAEGKAPWAADLGRLNSQLGSTLARLRIGRHKHNF